MDYRAELITLHNKTLNPELIVPARRVIDEEIAAHGRGEWCCLWTEAITDREAKRRRWWEE